MVLGGKGLDESANKNESEMLIRDESHYRIKFEEFEKMNKKEREKFFAHMGSLDLMFKSFQ